MNPSASVPVILLVEPDDNVRPVLRNNLLNWGYAVILALDGADAIQRTRGGREHIDLILINQFNQSVEQCIALGQQIRQSALLPHHTPIVVMAEQYGAELEGQNDDMGGGVYVTYLEDGQQLQDLLYRLCPI